MLEAPSKEWYDNRAQIRMSRKRSQPCRGLGEKCPPGTRKSKIINTKAWRTRVRAVLSCFRTERHSGDEDDRRWRGSHRQRWFLWGTVGHDKNFRCYSLFNGKLLKSDKVFTFSQSDTIPFSLATNPGANKCSVGPFYFELPEHMVHF